MGVIKSSNPLVRLYAGQIYYGHRTINDVPTHYLTEVQTELANYGEDPYIDDHWHFMTDVQGLVDALASKETPEGAQSKADKALTDAQAHTISKIAEMVNGSPAALDTLFEIAASLNNDPNFATTIVNQLGTKVDKVTGKVLSTNDYTSAEKTKLAGVETGANKYVLPCFIGYSVFINLKHIIYNVL